MRERANRTADLSDRDGFTRFHQSLAIASHLVVPKRERQTKRGRLSMNAVRSSDLWSVLEFMSATLQPLPGLAFFGPERAHFGQGVAFNHRKIQIRRLRRLH